MFLGKRKLRQKNCDTLGVTSPGWALPAPFDRSVPSPKFQETFFSPSSYI